MTDEDIPEASGAELGADLYQLVEAAQKYFPEMAEVYSKCTKNAERVSGDAEGGFSGLTGLDTSWNALMSTFTDILINTENNLNESGAALNECVVRYASQDEEAASTLGGLVDETNEGASEDDPTYSAPQFTGLDSGNIAPYAHSLTGDDS